MPVSPRWSPRGGGKRGVWDVREDGSGTWTRYSKGAERFQTLYRSGPSRAEVTCRETFDQDTGERLEVMSDYPFAKDLSGTLPGSVTRNLRTVFHFTKTSASIPPQGPLQVENEG